MAIDSQAGILYAVPREGPVVLVDLKTGKVAGQVDRPVPHEDWGPYITTDPASGTAYLLANRPSLLSVIDLASRQIVQHVEPAGVEPSGMTADFSGGVLYVTNLPSSLDAQVSVSILDAKTLTQIGSINVPGAPSSILFDPVTCQLVTSENNASDDTGINLVDPVTGSSRSLFFGKDWGGVGSIDSANGIVYQEGIEGLFAIDMATGNRTIVTTELVSAVAVDPAAGVVYAKTEATGGHSSALLIIDGPTHAVTGSIPLDFSAGAIELDEATGNLYVEDGSDGGSGTLTGAIRVFTN